MQITLERRQHREGSCFKSFNIIGENGLMPGNVFIESDGKYFFPNPHTTISYSAEELRAIADAMDMLIK